jgi:2'-5' RNA ligase
MAENEKHALWLRPFGDASFALKERINKLSKKFDTPVFEPHITLLSGLRRGKTELIQLTDTLAGVLSPFSVQLTEAGYRDHYFQSLFVQVKESSCFIAAQETAEKLFGCTTDEQYFPHLSLMYGNIKQQEKLKLLNTMNNHFQIQFPVHSILLIKTEGEVNDWKKIHSAEFKHH